VTDSRPIIFLGPSLSLEEARNLLDADYRPPAAQGDVLAAALEGPVAIGLIDGLFDRVPAVWHKEILWALGEGIAVYGAGSMGAIRAAELDRFGMRGVGQVYRAYRDGALEDEDEVAVAHAGYDEDWRALSDAMIDVRECLSRARHAGVITESAEETLARRVKETFYPQRRLDAVLDSRRADHQGLLVWLRANRVSVKREDARKLLEVIRADLEYRATTPASFDFARTVFFEAAYGSALASRATGVGPVPLGLIDRAEQDPMGQLLDELRLDPLRFNALLDEATAAALALEESERLGVLGGPWGDRSMVERFRRANGLFEAADLEHWLTEGGLDPGDLEAFGRRESALEAARQRHAVSIERQLMLSLGVSGLLPSLRRRAHEKAAEPAADSVLENEALLRWYFDGLGIERPPQLRAWVQQHGWADTDDFLRALRRERVYVEGASRRPAE
jgi:hypothetical protein